MKTETICRDVPCDRIIAERPRYYARQLITPDDMTLEQDYFRDKLRRHNRLLHGWGVVCGAQVCLVPKAERKSVNDFEPWQVLVKPGYSLGPYGDEIYIDCPRTVDLRTSGVTGITGEPCVEAPDPWCSEVLEPREAGDFYVAVRYKEILTRPVRVQPIGCGCDDTRCEYSRWRDGYEIGILTRCPDSHATPPKVEDLIKGPIPPCPPCPEEPWVVLAKVKLEADGKITKIDNCICRRMVVAFGHFWWQCQGAEGAKTGSQDQPTGETQPSGGEVKINGVEASESELKPGDHQIVIMGTNLDATDSISFGQGVSVIDRHGDSNKLVATVRIDTGAESGPRTMEYQDKDGNKFETKDAITIQRRESKPPASPTPPTTAQQSKRVRRVTTRRPPIA